MKDELKRKLLLALSERFSIKSIDIRDYLMKDNKTNETAIKYGKWSDLLQVSSSLNIKCGDIFL